MAALLVALCMLVACGPSESPSASSDGDVGCDGVQLTRASEVEVVARRVDAVAGVIIATERLTEEQRVAVQWALSRFELAGLLLPAQIEVVFDSAGSMCHGEIGECRPDQRVPVLIICGGPGDRFTTAEAKVVLLHEFAHIWHWSRGDGTSWPDYSSIVGGDYEHSGDIPPSKRAEERVAMIISWGLLDQTDRPVLPDMSCTEKYLKFQELAGTSPLGPLEPLCIP